MQRQRDHNITVAFGEKAPKDRTIQHFWLEKFHYGYERSGWRSERTYHHRRQLDVNLCPTVWVLAGDWNSFELPQTGREVEGKVWTPQKFIKYQRDYRYKTCPPHLLCYRNFLVAIKCMNKIGLHTSDGVTHSARRTMNQKRNTSRWRTCIKTLRLRWHYLSRSASGTVL